LMKSQRWAPPKKFWVDESKRWATPKKFWVDESKRWAPPKKFWVDESKWWEPLWVDADSKKCQICVVQMPQKPGTLFLSYTLSTQGGAHL
jgi:hypothetical protein